MRYLLIIFFACFSVMSFAERQPAYDSNSIVLRNFSAASIDTYKKDKAFDYNIATIEQPSLWDRFWMWFWQKVDEIMSTQSGKNTVYTVLIVLGVAAMVFLIVKINKMSKTSLFSKGGKEAMKYSVEDENINTINFETEIIKALHNGNYRFAIRLLYLQNLKLLSDREIIVWQSNKTNYDYECEIQSTATRSLFTGLTNIFEFAWYGNADMNYEAYERMRTKFTEIKNTLN